MPSDDYAAAQLYAIAHLPWWARYLPVANNVIGMSAFAMAVYFVWASGWKIAGLYFGGFILGHLVIAGGCSFISRLGDTQMLVAIILGTALTLALQILLLLHFLAIWTLF